MKGLIIIMLLFFNVSLFAQEDKINDYFGSSFDQRLKGNFDSSLYYINKVIETDTSNVVAYQEKIRILWDMKRNNETLLAAQKVSKLKNEMIVLVGLTYERLGDMEAAKKIYKQMLDNWNSYDVGDKPQAKMGRAIIVTVIEGKEKGLKELSKIDTTKFSALLKSSLEETVRSIQNYKGNGLLDSAFLPPKPDEPVQVVMPSSTITPHEAKGDSSYFIITISDSLYMTDFQKAKREFKTINELDIYIGKQKLLIKEDKLAIITNTENFESIKLVISLMTKYNLKHFELETEAERLRLENK